MCFFQLFEFLRAQIFWKISFFFNNVDFLFKKKLSLQLLDRLKHNFYIFQPILLPSFESTTKTKLSPGHDLPPDSTCLSWLNYYSILRSVEEYGCLIMGTLLYLLDVTRSTDNLSLVGQYCVNFISSNCICDLSRLTATSRWRCHSSL